MGTATLPPRAVSGVEPSRALHSRPAAGGGSAARAFLLRYTVTLLPIAAALVALQLGAQLLPDGGGTLGRGWPPAVAATAGWTLSVAAWLRLRGWATGTLVATGAGPAAVLATSAAAGWLSPAGLLLWGPVSGLLAVALALAAGTDGGPGQRTDQGLSCVG